MRAIATILATLALLAADVRGQDLSVAPLLFPRVRELGGLDWIRPGMRFTYFSTSATVRDNPTEIYLDSKGRRKTKPAGSGGMGYTQVDVVAVGPKGVAINTRYFLLAEAREGGPAKLSFQAGVVGTPASVADFWVHPAALADAQIGTVKAQGLTRNILRAIHPANNKKYQATRVDETGHESKRSWVWDNRSGVMLYMATESRVEGVNTERRFVSPGKSMAQLMYRSARQLKLPWARSPMPGWLVRVKRMEFEGILTTTVPGGMPPVETPRALRYDFVERGPNWTKIKAVGVAGGLRDLDPGTAGLMESTTRAELTVCVGPGMIGGAWIPPAGLTTLQAGQVIDKDPYTKVVATVEHAGMVQGRNVVVISEENAKVRIEYHYDAKSGGLLRMRTIDREFNMDTLLRLNNTK